MNRIDARGLSCPQPVLLAKQAMEKNEEPVAILADNAAAVENISRMAAHMGWTVRVEDEEEYSVVALCKQRA